MSLQWNSVAEVVGLEVCVCIINIHNTGCDWSYCTKLVHSPLSKLYFSMELRKENPV